MQGDTNYVGDGFMSIRTFVPCNDDDNCDVVDDIKANSLTSKRWFVVPVWSSGRY